MKKYIIKEPSKFLIKKRVLLINVFLFTVIMSFLIAGCIKEDYPVRLVFPVLTTTAVDTNVVTATSAVSGGSITSDGGYTISARGVCCSIYMNPSITVKDSIPAVGSVTIDGTGIGEFVSNVSGMAANKTYHIRAYATSSQGTSYGQDISFKTKAH